MRAIVLHAPGEISLEQRPVPAAGPGEVLVKVAAVGVCGSDLPRMLTKGAHKMPLITGHEFSGFIEHLGSGVEGWAEGELVSVAPLLPCGKCDQCLTGNYSRCRDYDYFGSRRDGAYAEYVAVPVENLIRTPVSVDPRAAAMNDPASIAIHAIWKGGGLQIGETAAVVGCGPIGLFAIQWLKMMGAGRIVAIDLNRNKLDLAEEAGATDVHLASAAVQDIPQAQLVIEAVGAQPSISRAVEIAAPGGRVSVIGIPTGDITLSNQLFQRILRQELRINGAWNSFGMPFPGPQWTTAIQKFATGELQWEFMISHELCLEELPEIFRRFAARDIEFSKVLFIPDRLPSSTQQSGTATVPAPDHGKRDAARGEPVE